MRTLALLSNTLAWFILGLGAAIAVGCPIAVPIYASHESVPVSWSAIASWTVVGLAMCAGSLLVLQRRPIGVWLSLVPVVALCSVGRVWAGLTYLAVVLPLFALPVLVYRSLSSARSIAR